MMVTGVKLVEKVVLCLPRMEKSAPLGTLALEETQHPVLLVSTAIGLVILETELLILPVLPNPQ
jgi:hypothetical protein